MFGSEISLLSVDGIGGGLDEVSGMETFGTAGNGIFSCVGMGGVLSSLLLLGFAAFRLLESLQICEH